MTHDTPDNLSRRGAFYVAIHALVHVGTSRSAEHLRSAEAVKRTAATLMNERSSRAHSIFMISLTQKGVRGNRKVESRLYMTDLGGSELVKKSGATGERLKVRDRQAGAPKDSQGKADHGSHCSTGTDLRPCDRAGGG
jgi:hypothetical protein